LHDHRNFLQKLLGVLIAGTGVGKKNKSARRLVSRRRLALRIWVSALVLTDAVGWLRRSLRCGHIHSNDGVNTARPMTLPSCSAIRVPSAWSRGCRLTGIGRTLPSLT